MSIAISSDERLFTLHTADTSYQMLVDDKNVLLHLYYGARLMPGDDISDVLYRSDMGFSGQPGEAGMDSTYSLDTLPQEVSGFGTGDFRGSMIELTHANGSRAAEFRYVAHKVLPHTAPLLGLPAAYDTPEEHGETLQITLREVASDIELTLNYGVFVRQNIITRSAVLANKGSTPVQIERFLSLNLDFPYGNFDMLYFAGRHAFERRMERVPVKRAAVQIDSVRGTSSHQYNPSFVLCDPAATEESGSCYGFCFVYSGNFMAQAQRSQNNQTRVLMGINPTGFCTALNGGESFCAPQVLLSYSAMGFARLSHQFHDMIREHVCRGKFKHEKRPVLINNWEATYFDFTQEKILALAEQAAALGIEMFVLDDGWFGKRNSDTSGLGDWYVNEEKIGGSLRELGEKVNDKNLKFGLWVEPEMISEDSDLYRSHPDWALQIPGRQPNLSRHQLVLDMSRYEVREYLLERLSAIVENAPIAYIKWDMNRSLSDVFSHSGPPTGALYHQYVLGLYDLLERFTARFPEVLLEGCSGGGGRFDAGMLYYCPQIWCSDNTDAINRLSIQYGTSFFYPISTMGAHVSACPNHQTGRSVPFSTRGDVALSGSFGYELDLGKITATEQQQIKMQIAQFHRYYALTHEGDYYRLTDFEQNDFVAWCFVAKDKKTALLCLVKTNAEGNPLPVHAAVRGLSPALQYRCSISETVRSGASWTAAGLTVPRPLDEYESVLVEFTAE